MTLLSALTTILVWWAAAGGRRHLGQVACSGRWSTGTNCGAATRTYAAPLMALLVFGVGGLITASFAWLAWQETLVLRHGEPPSTSPSQAEPRTDVLDPDRHPDRARAAPPPPSSARQRRPRAENHQRQQEP